MKSDPWLAQLQDVVQTAIGAGVDPNEVLDALGSLAGWVATQQQNPRQESPSSGGNAAEERPSSRGARRHR